MTRRGSLFAFLICTASLFCQPTAWRVDTIAGVWPLGNDGPASNALLARPRHLTYDRAGNLYIADTDNHQIRRVGRDGRIVAVAGNGTSGNSGDGGPALAATLSQPRAVAVDGNRLYIADSGNLRIRLVNLETGIIEPYAGTGAFGIAGDGGPAAQAQFILISSIAVDAERNLLISDAGMNRVRRVNRQTGVITTIVGWNGVVNILFPLSAPQGMAVEADGTFYVAASNRIVRVDPSGSARSILSAFIRIDTVALALDPTKRILYFTDSFQCLVGSVTLATGRVQLEAGNGSCRKPGDGAPGTGGLASPGGLAFDGANLVISDTDAGRIRRLNPEGQLESIVGRTPPFAADGVPAHEAFLSRPGRAIPDGAGGYLIAETGSCMIRRVNAQGIIPRLLAGRGFAGVRIPISRATSSRSSAIQWRWRGTAGGTST